MLLSITDRVDEAAEQFELGSELGNGRASLALADHYRQRGDPAGRRRQLKRAAHSHEEDVAQAARTELKEMERDSDA